MTKGLDRRHHFQGPARNPFAMLPPSPSTIAAAKRAGIDTTSRPAIDAWLITKGKPDA